MLVATDTALEVIQQVGREVGVSVVANPFGSTLADQVQLCALFNAAGRELALSHEWPQLRREHTITATGSEAGDFNLPADFHRMVPQTGWNQTTGLPFEPAGAQLWQDAKWGSGGVTPLTMIVRPWARGTATGGLKINPSPASGEKVSFEYLSRAWVWVGGTGTTYADTATQTTDVPLFEAHLLSRLMKLRYCEAKGLPILPAAAAEYQRVFNMVVGKAAGGARTLSLNGPRSGFRLIDSENLPDTGAGL